MVQRIHHSIMQSLDPIREKRHRLPLDDYKGINAVAFTLCIKNRAVLFNDREIFTLFEKILLEEPKKCGCKAEAYVFMPDHCHILLSGEDWNSDCLKAIIRFKQQTGFWLSKNKASIK